VTLGSGVASIGYQAFGGCSVLTNFTVAAANPNYASAGGVLFDKAITTLLQCPAGLASYAIPDGVTSIADNAFNSCYNLTNVTIASSVISIGESAFYYCSGLTSVTIPDSVGIINSYAFGICYNLTNVTFGSGVTNIGDGAFYDCSSLLSVTIPNSVTTIGDNPFQYCSSLTNLALGSGVTSIGYGAFQSCSALTTVTIPASVTSIGDSCFQDCTSLTQADFQGDAPLVDGWEAGSDDSSVFSGETGTVYYVALTAGWDTTFGGWPTAAFVPFVPFAYTYITNIDNTISITGCTGIGGNVTIPDTIDGLSVTGIGAGAFQHNSSLTNITIPASVISLGSLAFSDCTNLTEIHFPGNAPTADLTVFSGDNHAIVYYPPGATGWSSPFDGLLSGQQNPPSPAGDFYYYTTINDTIIINGLPRCRRRHRHPQHDQRPAGRRHREWSVRLQRQSDQRDDSQQCHQHRELSVL
jgi:hypothetical protein